MIYAGTALLLIFAAAQTPARFEVASIKPSGPGASPQNASLAFPPGRFEARNMTLADLLFALNGYTGRIEGGPDWTHADRYDIVAKSDGEVAPPDRAKAILALLAERFDLAVHRESRAESGLALAVGKKPPQITPSPDGEQPQAITDAHKAVFHAAPMARFVNYLHQMWHTEVVDRTGLDGKFDIAIDMDSAAQDLAPADGKPTFLDRVRAAVEQIGFLVQPAKVTVDITLIDHAARPEN